MLIPDVNVLINATDPNARRHLEARRWLERAMSERETLGILDVVATGYVRIMTNPRVWNKPLSSTVALNTVKTILSAPNAVLLHGNQTSWELFEGLVNLHRLAANDIPDAWIAAVAMAEEAVLISDDGGFARFSELRWSKVDDTAE